MDVGEMAFGYEVVHFLDKFAEGFCGTGIVHGFDTHGFAETTRVARHVHFRNERDVALAAVIDQIAEVVLGIEFSGSASEVFWVV